MISTLQLLGIPHDYRRHLQDLCLGSTTLGWHLLCYHVTINMNWHELTWTWTNGTFRHWINFTFDSLGVSKLRCHHEPHLHPSIRAMKGSGQIVPTIGLQCIPGTSDWSRTDSPTDMLPQELIIAKKNTLHLLKHSLPNIYSIYSLKFYTRRSCYHQLVMSPQCWANSIGRGWKFSFATACLVSAGDTFYLGDVHIYMYMYLYIYIYTHTFMLCVHLKGICTIYYVCTQ